MGGAQGLLYGIRFFESYMVRGQIPCQPGAAEECQFGPQSLQMTSYLIKKWSLGEVQNHFVYMIACFKNFKKSSQIASKWLWGSGGLDSIEFGKIAYKKMVWEEVRNHFFIRYLLQFDRFSIKIKMAYKQMVWEGDGNHFFIRYLVEFTRKSREFHRFSIEINRIQ